MDFKQAGNLGKVDLLQRHLLLKQTRTEGETIELSKEEIQEIEEQLSMFRHLLSNVNLHKNALENDQYRGLVKIIDELDPYYRDYQPNK